MLINPTGSFAVGHGRVASYPQIKETATGARRIVVCGRGGDLCGKTASFDLSNKTVTLNFKAKKTANCKVDSNGYIACGGLSDEQWTSIETVKVTK